MSLKSAFVGDFVDFPECGTVRIFKDYLLGTVLGTVPGILPFVLLGSFGLKALRTGDALPLVGALSLTGVLVAISTWYRRRRTFPPEAVESFKSSQPLDDKPPDNR